MHVALVGFMASGKSTVGRSLARRVRRPFVDTDAEIEREHGAIATIFSRQGEGIFRGFECEVVARALESPTPSIIAVGGGAPTHAPTRRLLAKAYRVFLLVPPEEIVLRVRRSRTLRPLLGKAPAPSRIEELYRSRLPLYREADLIVDTDGMRASALAKHIEALLESGGALS